jgi:hypothetical protein
MGVREIKKNHDSLLLNYPRACRIDDNLRVCAIPVSGRDAVFDYGMPVSLASATNYSTVYCVHGGSIKSQPIEQFIANLHTDVHKAFIRHSFQAEEGRPYSEFLLGLDYRNGWGTETNEALAIQWLQTAATAGSPEAQEFLRTNSPPPK